jgi:hypothetical protein
LKDADRHSQTVKAMHLLVATDVAFRAVGQASVRCLVGRLELLVPANRLDGEAKMPMMKRDDGLELQQKVNEGYHRRSNREIMIDSLMVFHVGMGQLQRPETCRRRYLEKSELRVENIVVGA